MNKNCIRKLSVFATALSFFAAGRGVAFADSFLNPAQNGYSLSKTFERPFLQSSPVPQVWQTDSSSEDFKRALFDAKSPETYQERHLNSLFWQADKADALNDFQSVIIDDRNTEETAIADLLNKLAPIVIEIHNLTVNDIEQINKKYAEYQKEVAEKEALDMQGRLIDLHTFFMVLKETVKTDVDLEILENKLKKESTAENKIFEKTSEAFFTDDVLKKAQDIYSTETDTMQMVRETDEVMWSLLVNDMLDLSTGTNMFLNDETYSVYEKSDFLPRSASLLDRDGKTDQIHQDNLHAAKKTIIQRLGRMSKNKLKKDVK